MQSFFITASGTGVGKTLVTAALCWQLRSAGKSVTALKPVISGYDEKDPESDVAVILRSCNLTPTPALVQAISPWRFSEALSPNMAAAHEGRNIDDEQLVEFCRAHEQLGTDIVLVEGVGGIMVPLAERFTVRDWAGELGWPVIMVTGSYLGALSHTLTACEAMAVRGIKLHALVVNESDNSSVSLDETAASLASFLPTDVAVVKIPRLAPCEDIWKQVPLISWICDL